MTIARPNYFLKYAPGLITALLVLTSCTAVDVQSPYLTARPYQQYAAKADAWLLQSQQASGLLPYYFQPSTASAEPKNYRLGQLIAAERLARLTKARSRVSTASKTQINTVLLLDTDGMLQLDLILQKLKWSNEPLLHNC